MHLSNPFRADPTSPREDVKPKALSAEAMASVKSGKPNDEAVAHMKRTPATLFDLAAGNRSFVEKMMDINARVKSLEAALSAEQDRAEADLNKSIDAFLSPEAG